ncbi:hypothetical protein BIV57_18040 [Mangrovactinospora gilvigrisea]|uniref:Uncharacterized protein n=1 Tax=Mangrovactinospora gilvigrisea TaxID=1428644 RepID=A0A1J7BBV6_9ACTN|nr:hypothetical protein [Mangrovactinospora gilvigrisea]OIV36139.1 hypothetical protein BIV57_18040 [Mangrovactinospora gilvigrisea]
MNAIQEIASVNEMIASMAELVGALDAVVVSAEFAQAKAEAAELDPLSKDFGARLEAVSARLAGIVDLAESVDPELFAELAA